MSDPTDGGAQRRLALLLEHMSALGHDLRNPIASLLLGVQRLERGGGPAGLQRVPALLSRMERSLRGMDRLVDALLDLTRVESGRLDIEPTGDAPAAIVARAVAPFATLAADGRRMLDVDAPEGIPTPAWDGPRTARALGHLVATALEFTPAGGTVRVSAREADGGILLEVEDGGPPLAPGEAERIFDGTADSAAVRVRSRAHGPFLYLARRLAERQGGRAQAATAASGGARLALWFPVAAP